MTDTRPRKPIPIGSRISAATVGVGTMAGIWWTDWRLAGMGIVLGLILIIVLAPRDGAT